MSLELKIWFLFLAFVVQRHLGTLGNGQAAEAQSGQAQVPCYFIFGDSLVDSGNNNELATDAKASYPPYGIDFTKGATGRFTNNLTSADIIGQLLGFREFIPPFTTSTVRQISKGVNYASGGSGIRDETGNNLGQHISLRQQLRNHQVTVSRLSRLRQNLTSMKKYLGQCIYTVNIGSNDYINNYFKPKFYPTSSLYTPVMYAEKLIEEYTRQLTMLYNLGARKIAIFGLGLIGCTPEEIARFGTGGQPCVEVINDAVQLFNDRLKPLVDELNSNLRDAKFTYINITSISSSSSSSSQSAVSLSSVPCCQIMSNGQCIPNSIPCPDRTLHIYYDGFHPTYDANKVLARRSYTALAPTDAYPVDISQLVQL